MNEVMAVLIKEVKRWSLLRWLRPERLWRPSAQLLLKARLSSKKAFHSTSKIFSIEEAGRRIPGRRDPCPGISLTGADGGRGLRPRHPGAGEQRAGADHHAHLQRAGAVRRKNRRSEGTNSRSLNRSKRALGVSRDR